MPHNSHNLQFTILPANCQQTAQLMNKHGNIHLESFVLKNSLDRSILSTGRKFCLKDHTEGSISNNLALCILHLSCFAGEAILHLFPYYLYDSASAHVPKGQYLNLGSRRGVWKGTYRPCASQRRHLQACFATSSSAREVRDPLWRRDGDLGRERRMCRKAKRKERCTVRSRRLTES